MPGGLRFLPWLPRAAVRTVLHSTHCTRLECLIEHSCVIVVMLGNQLSKALYLIRNKSLHYKLTLQHIAATHNVTTKVSECALDAAWLSEHGALVY